MTRRRPNLGVIGYLLAGGALPFQVHAQPAPDAGAIQRDLQKPSLDVPATPTPWFKLEEERARPVPGASDTRMVIKHVSVSGNTVFTQAELFALVQNVVGVTVGFADLEAAVARISRFYREHGYMVARPYLVRAYAPDPDMQNGIVEIAIIEGRYGSVVINNRSPVSESTLRHYTDALQGTVVRESQLERRLLLLNDLAGVGEARGSLRSGANVGESDLAVNISAAPIFSGRVEFDNHGNRYTGSNRLGVRLNVASPLGLGDALSARLTKGFNGLEYGRLQYQVPLGGGACEWAARIQHLGISWARHLRPWRRKVTQTITR